MRRFGTKKVDILFFNFDYYRFRERSGFSDTDEKINQEEDRHTLSILLTIIK